MKFGYMKPIHCYTISHRFRESVFLGRANDVAVCRDVPALFADEALAVSFMGELLPKGFADDWEVVCITVEDTRMPREAQ